MAAKLNLSNRCIRIRMYGGVGGAEERSSPLSRSESVRHDCGEAALCHLELQGLQPGIS